jgi:hypothetical protein
VLEQNKKKKQLAHFFTKDLILFLSTAFNKLINIGLNRPIPNKNKQINNP